MRNDAQLAISQDTAPYANQRTHERVPLEIEVDMESEHNFYAGITDNISQGGVFIATHVPPPLGSVVEMRLTVPGCEHPFSIRGAVRWIRDVSHASNDAPPGCGIQWLEMSRDALAAIQRFVTHRDTLFIDTDDLQ